MGDCLFAALLLATASSMIRSRRRLIVHHPRISASPTIGSEPQEYQQEYAEGSPKRLCTILCTSKRAFAS